MNAENIRIGWEKAALHIYTSNFPNIPRDP